MKSSFSFTDVEIIAVPATGFVNYFRFLRTLQAVLVWKERFDAAIILKNYLEVDKIEVDMISGIERFSCSADLSKVTE